MFRKVVRQLLLILCVLKKKKYVQFIFQNLFKLWKTNNSIDDSKWRKRKLALSCSKKLSALVRGTTSKHDSDFYCLNFLYFLRKETRLKSHEKVCKNEDFCDI